MPLAAKHQQAPLDFGTATAGEITSAILAYLTLQGFAVWRQNTAGIYDQKTGRYRLNPQARKGVPDIIGFRKSDGVFIGVEVKAGRDQLRPEQKQFLDELKAARGLAFVAHDLAGFINSFEARGLHIQRQNKVSPPRPAQSSASPPANPQTCTAPRSAAAAPRTARSE